MPTDAEIVAAVNVHQRTDKGFGPALGPAAAQAAVEQFERLGICGDAGCGRLGVSARDREIQTGDAVRLGRRRA